MASIVIDPTKVGYAGLLELISPREGFNNDINNANYRVGVLWTADRSEQMNGFKIVMDGNNGTVTNGCTANMYAVDATYEPTGGALATATFTPANGNVQTVAWSVAYTVTSGTTYIVVFQNVLASPNVNFFRMKPSPTYLGNLYLRSDDASSTWGYRADVGNSPCLSIKFQPNYNSSGTVGYVFPGTGGGSGGVALYNTSGARVARIANKYNFPVAVRVWGIIVDTGGSKTGSPTHDLKGEISSSSASLATGTNLVGLGSIAQGQAYWFESGYLLSANTDYYIGVTPNGATAGDSSNYYQLMLSGAPVAPSVASASQCVLTGAYESTANGSPSWSAKSYFLQSTLLYTLDSAGGGSGTFGHVSF